MGRDVRMVATLGSILGTENILYLDLGGNYTGILYVLCGPNCVCPSSVWLYVEMGPPRA